MVEVGKPLRREALGQLALDDHVLHLVAQELVVDVAGHGGLVHGKGLEGALHSAEGGGIRACVATGAWGPLAPAKGFRCGLLKSHPPSRLKRLHPPVKGGGLPDKVHLEVVGHLHGGPDAAPQLDGYLVTVIFAILLSGNFHEQLQPS